MSRFRLSEHSTRPSSNDRPVDRATEQVERARNIGYLMLLRAILSGDDTLEAETHGRASAPAVMRVPVRESVAR